MLLNRPVLLAVVLVAVAAVACSSGAAPDASSTTTSPPEAPPAPPTAVQVHPAVTPTSKTTGGTLRTPDGRVRTFHVSVPSTIEPGRSQPRVPLLVALHGGLGSGQQFERTSGFDGLAEANRFIVVYPDGVGVGPHQRNRTWNSGACCGVAQRENVDDVTFVRMLIERLQSQYAIDRARTFAAGHSNGGMEAYRLACELSDQIVAIGVQSSSLELDRCAPAHPVSLVHIHGTADQNVPIAGGVGANAISGVSFRPPMFGATTFAALDGCPGRSRDSVDPDNPDVSIRTWGPGADGTEVRFMTVAGAAHAWMGAGVVTRRPDNPTYPKLDSSAVIWKFLVNHPRHDAGRT